MSDSKSSQESGAQECACCGRRLTPSSRFGGKVAVVVGGNSGIGLASARALAEEGASVVITGRNLVTLQNAALLIGHGVATHRCDISNLREIDSLFAQVRNAQGRIDVLFVNAGVLAFSPVEKVSEADWDWLHNINLKGVFFTIQRAIPLLPRGSAIVLTGSTAGRQAVPTASVYGASKAALRSLGRTLAAELLSKGIRVNVVSPGPTDTPIFARARGLSEADVLLQRSMEIESVPMRRMGTPTEVAAAVLFLLSDAAAFVTGIELLVSGGSGNF